MCVSQSFFFPRFKNRNTGDNRGADFQKFLQPWNFANSAENCDPCQWKENWALLIDCGPVSSVDIDYKIHSILKHNKICIEPLNRKK